ncbi:hypothetical protein CXF83_17285 [Shewanella sp. Choline-02u-19]|uniref:DUF2798 domain-containing protein n=1 Tax=unclassified Shewanella TaxID=196818 RepID=UPI000C330F03|nr:MULTISPECIES: DUF2798 domain-containing protein [unclassified Shewanella]PKG57105.1 hypothetical protein CXF82_11695 [Shewanella sp. GutDb-MelDb]PKH57371.1 hypothetical protein CXF84_08620 [Shewanella sp. Bg11-22]PKI28328.1 hypothetical protein CXF83_17285 [Shewanella sp. Choline-02u-19]
MKNMAKKILVTVSLVLTLIGSLTFVMTYKNIGFGEQFLYQWIASTLIVAITMAPIGFMMVAVISKIVVLVLPRASESKRNVIIGVAMALVMESIMALVTTLNNIEFTTLSELMNVWWSALIIALPLGLLISLMMTTLVKPKLERYLAS